MPYERAKDIFPGKHTRTPTTRRFGSAKHPMTSNGRCPKKVCSQISEKTP